MAKRRIRDFTWEDYGISTNRYKELKNFCLQYEEKKSKIKYGIGPICRDGMPRGNVSENQVEQIAIKNIIYRHDCKIIEQATLQANPSIYRYMLKSVTNDLPFELIEYNDEIGRITICRTDFYGYRRLFYFYLHQLQIGYKSSEVS